MTDDHLAALYALVAAVREWEYSLPALAARAASSPEERRLTDALAAVEACNADVAAVVALSASYAEWFADE